MVVLLDQLAAIHGYTTALQADKALPWLSSWIEGRGSQRRREGFRGGELMRYPTRLEPPGSALCFIVQPARATGAVSLTQPRRPRAALLAELPIR